MLIEIIITVSILLIMLLSFLYEQQQPKKTRFESNDEPFPLHGVYQVFAPRINIPRPDEILDAVL